MNSVLIAFLVIVIIIATVYAVSYLTLDYLIRDPTSLTPKGDDRTAIDSDKFDNPGSSRYYYEGWFFITGNQKITEHNILFNRGTNFVVTLKESDLHVFVNGKAGSVNIVNGTFNPEGASLAMQVPNFPFQKWALLVINVDGMSIDLYVDGKFVQNKLHSTIINTNTKDSISVGSKFISGKVVRFRRPAESINPQGVWNHYVRGSGQSNSLTDYHLNTIITKNQREILNKRLL